MKKAKYDRTAGGSRKPIQLLPDLESHRKLRLAAASEGVPLTQFVLESATARAEKILNKITN